LTDRGYIRVNDRLETTQPNIWAIGECAGSPQFTHVSLDDFRVIRDNLNGGSRSTRDRMTPYCMFIDPPLARIGMSEADARAKGVKLRVAKLPMTAVLRTRTTSESGEVMAVVQTAMLAKLPYMALRDAILAHPTMAEGLNALFGNVPPKNG
jgi:pyruvate/2-oxoglutarate dehydrogenase complex dihydrolipoamide dehydrogenase (E3) component